MSDRKLGPEEILAELAASAREDRLPFQGQARPGEAPPDPDAFSAADLAGDYTLAREVYRMPGGKKLWIGALSDADMATLLQWTLERVENPDPEDASDDRTRRMRQARRTSEAQYVGRSFQVILCCWRGPEGGARRVFDRSDFPSVHHRLPFGVITEIVGISDRLGGTDELLATGVARFFDVARRCLQTCASRLAGSTGSPDGWQATLAQFGSLVSRVISAGKIRAADLEALDGIVWPAE